MIFVVQFVGLLNDFIDYKKAVEPTFRGFEVEGILSVSSNTVSWIFFLVRVFAGLRLRHAASVSPKKSASGSKTIPRNNFFGVEVQIHKLRDIHTYYSQILNIKQKFH